MAQFFRGGISSMPPVTKNIIIINALIWLVEVIAPQFGTNGIIRHLGLHFVSASYFNPAQIITYMFVHDQRTFFHVFFNMLTLFFFGPMLERMWGARKFLFYYMVCGVGAALIQEGVWGLEWHHIVSDWEMDNAKAIAASNDLSIEQALAHFRAMVERDNPAIVSQMEAVKNGMVTVGASGAIFGILLGFAFLFPNMPLYLFFIPIPIKAKYMVAGYAVIEFFCGISGTAITVAHFAHLGGMLFGLILLLYWRKKGTLTSGSNNFF